MRNPQPVLFPVATLPPNLPERREVPPEGTNRGQPDFYCVCSSQAILGVLRDNPTLTCSDAPWACPYAEITSTPTT